MKSDSKNIILRNKKASHEFNFIEQFTAGIQLTGTEIKSLRMGKANLADAYCVFHEGELFIKGMHIAEYWWGNLNNHDPMRERKLLLTARELRKIERKVRETGLTIIPLLVFLNEKGLAKVEIAIARGKKEYDKRQSIKQKDTQREIDRQMKK